MRNNILEEGKSYGPFDIPTVLTCFEPVSLSISLSRASRASFTLLKISPIPLPNFSSISRFSASRSASVMDATLRAFSSPTWRSQSSSEASAPLGDCACAGAVVNADAVDTNGGSLRRAEAFPPAIFFSRFLANALFERCCTAGKPVAVVFEDEGAAGVES